jgi:hypothetical protein
MRKQIWDTIIKQSQYIVVCESVVTQTKLLRRHSYVIEIEVISPAVNISQHLQHLHYAYSLHK